MTVARGRSVPVLLVAAALVLAGGLAGAAVAALERGPGCAPWAGDTCTRVLFIGNSYTSVNDLPATFARLAASGGHPVEATMIAPGGALLADHAANPDVAAAIAGTRWSAVILQEQSQVPASPASRDGQMAPAASTLVAEVRADGAVPYLLETWAHRDGWPEAGLSRAAMQAAIDAAYAQVAARTAAFVVPAGEAWQRALAADPALVLWQDDGSHPTAAGTYLAACVLYRALWHASPVGLSDTGGLDAGVAAELQRAAGG